MQTEPISRIARLTEAHVEGTADILARAFDVDEAYRYLFPDPATRLRGLRDFFLGNLRTHLTRGSTYVAEDAAGRLMATVTLRLPNARKISWWTMLRHGLLPFALAHGRGAVQRLLWLKDTYDALEADTAEQQPHAYVHMMAVSPECQGRGVGSFLLAQLLSTHAADPGLGCTVLSTHLPRNLVFYRRHGFELVREQTLNPPRSHAYAVWTMRRGRG